jgi:hypothetical protein
MPTPSRPRSLADLLSAFGPCFTQPTFGTFQALVAGFLTQPGQRTVTGMLVGARPAGRRHHDLAYRSFASARWSADQLGLVLLDLIAAIQVPAGTPLLLAPTTHSGAAVAHGCTTPPGTTTALAPAVTGPPEATAESWSAPSSSCPSLTGRCACRSWPGCGSPATPTTPRSYWPANWLTWPQATSATVPYSWSATPPTSASRCEDCPPTSP